MKTVEQMEQMEEDRNWAEGMSDLAECLRLDDLLEDYGMHGDERVTCFTHKWWSEGHNQEGEW